MKILVTPTSLTANTISPAMNNLRSFADTLVFNPSGKPLTENELITLLENCEGCIAGVDYFTAKVMENVKTLKVISRYGTGTDRVDIEAARKKNIVVCNTPGVNARSVADLAFALLLCVARKVHKLDVKTRAGEWPRSSGMELHGKTAGILGLGAVGKETARRALGFSMNVIASDPVIDKNYTAANNITPVSLTALIEESDVLFLHLPLTEKTKNIISSAEMEKMKKGAVIINTARGGLMDEDAAHRLLVSGHLGGLGLDVFEIEPPKKSPLFELDNVVVTPHTAAHTAEASEAMAVLSVQNLIDVLEGKPCPYTLD